MGRHGACVWRGIPPNGPVNGSAERGFPRGLVQNRTIALDVLNFIMQQCLHEGGKMNATRYMLLALVLAGTVLGQESLDERLLVATKQGELATVQSLLAKGANPNWRGPNGWSLLMSAAQTPKGKLPIMQALLAKGARVNDQSADGMTALIIATHAGRVDAVELLLFKKADVNKMSSNGVTALLAAAYMKQHGMVDMLLAKGANVNAQTSDTGMTPLMYAAQAGNASRVKSLLAYHADTMPKNKEGKTALSLAKSANASEVVKLLESANAAVH
jgi:ankyrin repeat protein